MRIPPVMAPLVVLALLAGLAPARARADDLTDRARRDVTAGLAAQSAGRYDEAIALYKKAFDAIPHPEILFDLGQAYRLKGDADTALGYYRRYLAVAPNGRVARDARHWVAELTRQIADNKRRQDPPGVGVDPFSADSAAAGPPRISTSPSTDRAAPVAPGTQAPAAGASAAPGAVVAGPTRPAAAPDPAASARRRTYAWIAAGAGSGAVIGGLVVGSLARSKLDAATRICGADHRCDDSADLARANALLAQSRTRGNVATLLVVVGVAGLGTGAALWWTGRHDDAPRAAVAPVVGPDGIGAAVAGVF